MSVNIGDRYTSEDGFELEIRKKISGNWYQYARIGMDCGGYIHRDCLITGFTRVKA